MKKKISFNLFLISILYSVFLFGTNCKYERNLTEIENHILEWESNSIASDSVNNFDVSKNFKIVFLKSNQCVIQIDVEKDLDRTTILEGGKYHIDYSEHGNDIIINSPNTRISITKIRSGEFKIIFENEEIIAQTQFVKRKNLDYITWIKSELQGDWRAIKEENCFFRSLTFEAKSSSILLLFESWSDESKIIDYITEFQLIVLENGNLYWLDIEVNENIDVDLKTIHVRYVKDYQFFGCGLTLINR